MPLPMLLFGIPNFRRGGLVGWYVTSDSNIGHVLDHMIKKPTNRDRLCGDRIVGLIAIGF
ncbi:predicted protein [Sclerotinia sclerotiorum 1980 UF-70]|uniref:Uncharacterized protein n=1 Tax=Sclerotinia sclerotiorum (strain ATCC 18683 / 1980 / Ss-1) TaxID=665079 RepID=A7E8T2_SCLS1|nr:predicted protein [Sclerotinia sclerotiorum 1980 UF-70]EDN96784.1 predicted protein [Sclerotinia sclerotiorum 1980 UF-70]